MNDLRALMNDVVAAREEVRTRRPLIQCLTNHVVSHITADVLLAVGASPAMADNSHEAGDFAAVADGVLINVGTPTDDTASAMRKAAAASRGPWVLDPVAVGGLEFRTTLCHDLLQFSPTVIRGNASEIAALAGQGAGGRGVDATDEVLAVRPSASDLSRRTGAVVAVSGPQDLVVMGQHAVTITGGHDLMPLVIGTGCALGAMVAAYAAVCEDPFVAAVAAHAHTAAAGVVAGRRTTAPAAFGIAWRDALFEMDGDTLRGAVTLTEAAS